MPRFFVDRHAVDTGNRRIEIAGEDVRHIKNVLRCSCGDCLTVSDGCGNEYDVVIEAVEKDRILTRIEAAGHSSTEPPIEVTLYQGVPKSDRMDYIIQKSVELGVARIVPVITSRTVVRFDGEKDVAAKTARWNRISLEAAKQCSRGIVPVIDRPVRFDDVLAVSVECGLRIIPYEMKKERNLKEFLKRACNNRISVYIGPEGGFDESEIDKAVQSGIQPVSLGPRILRTETAGPAVLSILMYELGDMG